VCEARRGRGFERAAKANVTNEVLASFSNLARLTRLDLGGAKLDDSAIPHLLKLKTLQFLNLTDTNISDHGLAQLTSGLPGCKVSAD
jgi:hypothetical protein